MLILQRQRIVPEDHRQVNNVRSSAFEHVFVADRLGRLSRRYIRTKRRNVAGLRLFRQPVRRQPLCSGRGREAQGEHEKEDEKCEVLRFHGVSPFEM